MHIAFCLFKYFPFGGLQRDFLRIARECQSRGHQIRVYTLSWQGEIPEGFDVVLVPARAYSNHRRYEKYADWVIRALNESPVDRVVGFNKMPGLDFYFAADPCFEDKARSLRSRFYRMTSRYKHFAAFEQAVFARESTTKIMFISPAQRQTYCTCYQTPVERLTLLPPGIALDRRRPVTAELVRREFRAEFCLRPDDYLLVQIGSGFQTKGLDRSLQALAALPESLRTKTRLLAIGQDNPAPFFKMAKQLGLAGQVDILPGRNDIPRFLLGADLLIHPAYSEAAGMILLEAVVAGLPVLTTDSCGYAHYIRDAEAGRVLVSPFSQAALNTALENILCDPALRSQWQTNGLHFADSADIYRLPEYAADFILESAR